MDKLTFLRILFSLMTMWLLHQKHSCVSKSVNYSYCFTALFIWLVLAITCLRGQFGMDCPSAFLKILKNHKVIYLQNHPNQTCNYWIITPNQQTLCIGITRLQELQDSGQLQNNSVNSAMLITIKRVIKKLICEKIMVLYFMKFKCIVDCRHHFRKGGGGGLL